MKVQVAPPAWVPRKLPPTATAEPAPPPATIDLTRQLAFGKSTVDEAGVVLIELSVLAYRPLDSIRRTLETLKLDACTAMDAGRDRDGDWRWLQTRETTGWLKFGQLSALTGRSGSALSPPASSVLQQAVARMGNLDPWTTDPKNPALPTPLPSVANPVVPPDGELALRNTAPRVLAVLHERNALLVFRGTGTRQDWVRDLFCWPAWAWPLRHYGFEKTWQEVKPQVDAWLQKMTRRIGHKPIVYLGGHSLGGAVATLAAADLSSRYDVARVVTLGCPRVGGWGFKRHYAGGVAAPSAATPKRKLLDVSTRWVHGSDMFATLLPPPGPTVHVVAASKLTPRDRHDVRDHFSNQLMDTPPVVNRVSRGQARNPFVGQTPQPRSWQSDARRSASQIMLWLALSMPWNWWTRLFLPILPMLAEQFARSGYQHKSDRYLEFMPPTALGRGMARALPTNMQQQPVGPTRRK